MILTTQEIETIRKDTIKLDFSLNNDEITLDKLYLKANRGAYETALLFQHAYTFCINIENQTLALKLNENEELFKELNKELLNFHSFAGYNQCKIRLFVEDHQIFIYQLIDLVFGKILLNKKSDEKPSWRNTVDGLKDKKREEKKK